MKKYLPTNTDARFNLRIDMNTIVANRKLASTNKPVAFRSVHTGIEPPFLLKYIMGSLLALLGLYIQKILTKREMINRQKFNFLLFLPINSVTTAVRELNGTSQISLVTHDARAKCERSRWGIVRSRENEWTPQIEQTHENIAQPRGYKTFFMLNSTEHEISTAYKN